MKFQVIAWFLFQVIILFHSATSAALQSLANATLTTQDDLNSTNGHNEPRIIGGTKPRGGVYPFVAKIRWMFYYTRPKGAVDEIQCSAVIISQEFVLTAASCFQIIIYDKRKKDGALLDIKLTRDYGRTFVLVDGENDAGVPVTRHRSGVRLIVHSDYLHPSSMFDVNIALIQVVPRWSLVSIMTLKLPTPARNLVPNDRNNYNCVGVGTGKVRPGIYTWEDQEKSTFQLTMGGVNYCKYLHKEFNQKSVHVDTFYMCGKTNKQGQDFCHGDLGSALICNGLLAGIMSQRIVTAPCQLTGRQFTMFTAVGSKVAYDFIKTYVPEFKEPQDIPPPRDPWDPKARSEWLEYIEEVQRNKTKSENVTRSIDGLKGFGDGIKGMSGE